MKSFDFSNKNFTEKIDAATKSHEKILSNIYEIIKMEEMRAEWEKTKIRAVEIFCKFRSNCDSSFGLYFPVKCGFWLSFSDSKKINISCEEFNKECSQLLGDIMHCYRKKKIPEGLDVSELYESLGNLSEHTEKLQYMSSKIVSELEESKTMLSENLNEISSHLLEELPYESKLALFRIYQKIISGDNTLYPTMFGLKNMDEKVIDILNGNLQFS